MLESKILLNCTVCSLVFQDDETLQSCLQLLGMACILQTMANSEDFKGTHDQQQIPIQNDD